MAVGSTHTIPIGKGWIKDRVFSTQTKLNVVEHVSDQGGQFLRMRHPPRDSGIVMTLEDAEQLCFLLFDLTQPLRDAREAKPPAQGGENEAGNHQSG